MDSSSSAALHTALLALVLLHLASYLRSATKAAGAGLGLRSHAYVCLPTCLLSPYSRPPLYPPAQSMIDIVQNQNLAQSGLS